MRRRNVVRGERTQMKLYEKRMTGEERGSFLK